MCFVKDIYYPSTYSKEEIAKFREEDEKLIEYDGVKKTGNGWKNEQRKLETEIRYKKDEANALKAVGDMQGRREKQSQINRLQAKYDDLSEKTGLQTNHERMEVKGFSKVKAVDVDKGLKKSNDGVANNEIDRPLAVRNGDINNIRTTNSNTIPIKIQKDIDEELHSLCNSMNIDSSKINEILFDDLGDDIARASVSSDMYIKLKFNNKIFSSETELNKLLETQTDNFTPKNGLNGYVAHELTHIKEYLYSVNKNTVNGILDKDKAFDEISRSVYAKEILKDALKACNLDYNRGIIGKNISLYGTYNSSEAIAEAVSNSTSNDLCDKIKELYKKKWR